MFKYYYNMQYALQNMICFIQTEQINMYIKV